MKEIEPAEVQRKLAGAFSAQGWTYDLGVGRELVEALDDETYTSEKFAAQLSRTFYEQNRTTPAHVAAVIESVVGGAKLRRAAEPLSIVIEDNRHQVNLGAGASVVNSNLNVGTGGQLTIDVSSNKEDVLAAVEALVRSGLAGQWNGAAAADLAAVIHDRDDIEVEEVHTTAVRAATNLAPSQGQVRGLLREIAAGGLGGALASGITAALGALLQNLPL